MTCFLIGCDRDVVARALCKKHYERAARRGEIPKRNRELCFNQLHSAPEGGGKCRQCAIDGERRRKLERQAARPCKDCGVVVGKSKSFCAACARRHRNTLSTRWYAAHREEVRRYRNLHSRIGFLLYGRASALTGMNPELLMAARAVAQTKMAIKEIRSGKSTDGKWSRNAHVGSA